NKGVSLGLGALLISGGLLMAGPAQAAHDPQAGFNPAFSGAPQDDVADHIADRPGSDKMNLDRNPDRTSRDRNTADAGDGNEDRSQNMDNESPFRDDGPAGGQNGTPDRTGNRDGGGAQSPGPGVNGSNRPGGVRDATPDCGNGPGDGNCGNGPSAGDNTQDNFGAGDDLADNSPDRPIGFNRIGDDVGDELPEKAHSDRLIILNGGTLVRDRVNARDCNAEDVAQGECDDRLANNPDEGFRDRVGREGNNHDWTLDGKNRLGIPDKDISGADDPRRVARDGNSNGAGCDFNCGDGVPSGKPSQVADRAILGLSDGMPDGVMSRDRDSGFANHNQASRDAFATGAGDRARDDRPDEGSLGFGDPSIPSAANEGTVGPGGGPGPQGETGDDGCSFAANGTTNPLKAGIFMAILLAPLALIWIRRQKLTRSAMKITAWFGGALLVFGIGAGTGMTGEAHAAHNPMDNFDSTQELGWPGDEVGDSDSDQDKPGYDRFEDGRPDRPNEDSTPSGVSDRSSNMDNTPSTDGTPDGTPSRDRVAPRSRVTDGSPDCG
ncbi:MAG TPA: hypothetical protein VLB09_07875, partial [Nitrospiria bacterium]|nr:hypothetical protein [Nitrospiria bacterium]